MVRRRPDPPPAPPRPQPLLPGIAPPIPVVRDQLDIAHRLHLIASSVPAGYFVSIQARDLVALLNGFWSESRRADQAEARLQALTTSRAESHLDNLLGPSPAASN